MVGDMSRNVAMDQLVDQLIDECVRQAGTRRDTDSSNNSMEFSTVTESEEKQIDRFLYEQVEQVESSMSVKEINELVQQLWIKMEKEIENLAGLIKESSSVVVNVADTYSVRKQVDKYREMLQEVERSGLRIEQLFAAVDELLLDVGQQSEEFQQQIGKLREAWGATLEAILSRITHLTNGFAGNDGITEQRNIGEETVPERDVDMEDDESEGEKEKISIVKGRSLATDKTVYERTSEDEKETQLLTTNDNEEMQVAKDDEDDLYDNNVDDEEIVFKVSRRKTGPPAYEKCQYEIIRDQIIAEREALMRQVLADIKRTSEEILEENLKLKKRKPEDEGNGNRKRRKTEKVADVVGVRKSLREKKPVSYISKQDEDWKKTKGRKIKKFRDIHMDNFKDRNPLPKGWHPIHNPLEKYQDEGTSSSDKDAKSKSSKVELGKINLRPRPRYRTNYNFGGCNEDEFIFCRKCRTDKHHGCDIHPLKFNYEAKIDVCTSNAGKNAGRGVFNIDPTTCIPEGVMFGPYQGRYYDLKAYEHMKKKRGESGYAWEIRDRQEKIDVVGYVDPGPDPHPFQQWMALVNMAPKNRLQNMEAVQYCGEIYYETISEIPFGQEFMVDYGDSYARELNINVAEKDVYDLKEDWGEEGQICPYCKLGVTDAEALQNHIDAIKKGFGAGCAALRRMWNKVDVVLGVKPHVCRECGMGFDFPSALKKHKTSHSNLRPFQCSQCEKAYRLVENLNEHVKIEHEGLRFPCPDCQKQFKSRTSMKTHQRNACNHKEKEFKCPQCGRKFNRKDGLTNHIKEVHNRERPFKCELCDKRFFKKSNLKVHISSVHEMNRPFDCEDCVETFKTAAARDRHRARIHTHQFPWNCDICNKRAFVLRCELKKHMLLHHPTEYKEQFERENPAVCPKCLKRFPAEECVQRHIKKMHKCY